ncbi:unnamed protein product [Laminaria digitata]
MSLVSLWLDQSLCPRHRSLCGFVAWNVQQAAASALTLTTPCRDCCRGADYLVRRSSGAVFLLHFTSRHVESPVHGVQRVVVIALSYPQVGRLYYFQPSVWQGRRPKDT